MKLALNKIKPNAENPRTITEEKFEELCQSLRDAPWMLDLRPLVIDEDNVLLGGNMRLKALQHLDYKDVPVSIAKGLTEEQKREFIIKDNVSFGTWDWDELANSWDNLDLRSWGLQVWIPEAAIDYSVLDSDEFSGIDDRVEEIAEKTRKAIQVDFLLADFDEAYGLFKKARENGWDYQGAILNLLRDELG